MKHRKLQKRFVAMLLCLALLFSGVVSAGADPLGDGDGVDNTLYPTKPIWSPRCGRHDSSGLKSGGCNTAWFWPITPIPQLEFWI